MATASSPPTLQRAIEHHQAGRLPQAEALYREIIALDPNCADALHLLGVVALQVGRHEIAVDLIRRAAELAPNRADFHSNLGEAYRGLARLDEAAASFRRALALQPEFPAASNSLGSVLATQGQTDEALTCLQRAIRLKPDYANAHHNLGNVFAQRGQLEEAQASFQRALVLRPGAAETHHCLGKVYLERGQLDPAIASHRQAVALKSDFAEAHNDLGTALLAQNRLDEAFAAYQQAVALKPRSAEAHNNLGGVFRARGQLDDALACYQRALALKPELADGHNNLGVVFRARGQLDDALASYQRAVALKPDFAEAHNNLGGVFKERGQLDDALASYQRALTLKPDYAEAHSNLILALLYRSGHEAAPIDAELHRWQARHARRAADFAPHTNDRSPTRRLRLGYLSPDFCSHPVGRFLLPLFAHHSRASFEIFCYSNTPRADRVTAAFRSSADGWRDIAGQTDRQAADLIRADRIDLLVDLALHTAKSRLPVLAHKPAPVQATYLAYPGKSGLDTVDFRLTDIHLDPLDDSSPRGCERPIRLPETYWCYEPADPSLPEVNALPTLAAGRVTFGCLNNFCKVTPAALAAWCRLLAAVPGSRLLLHVRSGSHRSLVRDFFAGHSIAAARLEFADFAPEAQYFQQYQAIDLGLDPFPFPGGTTTCDALWMGVPVITLAGPTPVTRGGLSLLSNVGLPELAAYSVDDYVEKAAALARDLPRLAALRAGLRERMQRSPLLDAPRFTRNLEAAYRTLWQSWCAQPEGVAAPSSPA